MNCVPRFLLPILSPVLLTLATGGAASADMLPHRKAGLWETTMQMQHAAGREFKSQQCTDDKTDEALQRHALENPSMKCERTQLTRIPGGFVSESVCRTAAGTLTTTARVIGDMQSAYHIEISGHRDPPTPGTGDTRTTMEARWLGACPADMKPGDLRMNGMTMHLGEGMSGLKGPAAAGGMPGAAGNSDPGGIDAQALRSMTPAERLQYVQKMMQSRAPQQQ